MHIFSAIAYFLSNPQQKKKIKVRYPGQDSHGKNGGNGKNCKNGENSNTNNNNNIISPVQVCEPRYFFGGVNSQNSQFFGGDRQLLEYQAGIVRGGLYQVSIRFTETWFRWRKLHFLEPIVVIFYYFFFFNYL